MKFRLKGFSEDDFYSFSLSTFSGRHDIGGIAVLTSIWIFVGPIMVFGSRYYFVDYIGYVPNVIYPIYVLILSVSILCIPMSLVKIREKFSLIQSLLLPIIAFFVSVSIFIFGFIEYLEYLISQSRGIDLSKTILDRYLTIGYIVLLLSTFLGYISVLKYIKRGNGRKGEKTFNSEEFFLILVTSLSPLAYSFILLMNNGLGNDLIYMLIYFLTACYIQYSLPRLFMVFYTKWRFPNLYKRGGKR